MLENFKEWWSEATPVEKKELAEYAGSSLNFLYQLSYRTGTGSRPAQVSPEYAGRLEDAIRIINAASRHTPLPDVTRGDLNPVCAACPYYKGCKNV